MYLSPTRCTITYSPGKVRNSNTQMQRVEYKNKTKALSACWPGIGEASHFCSWWEDPLTNTRRLSKKKKTNQPTVEPTLRPRGSLGQRPRLGVGAGQGREWTHTDGSTSLRCYFTANTGETKGNEDLWCAIQQLKKAYRAFGFVRSLHTL